MKHEIPWNKNLLNEFVSLCHLTEEEVGVLNLRCKDMTRCAIAGKLHMSEATVSRVVDRIKEKYDDLVEQFPEKFPPRRKARHYKLKYKNFKGTLTASNKGEIYSIDLKNKDFNSLEEARKYIIQQVEKMSLEEFGKLDELNMNIVLNFDIKIRG